MSKYQNTFLGLILIGIFFIPAIVTAQDFMPNWRVGDSWVIEARYRNASGDGDEWLPAIRWQFRVRNLKTIDGVSCFVLHITPAERNDLKVQTILCLAESDLRLVRAIDIYPVRGRAEKFERDADISRYSPLLRNGSMVPYDMPLFPLAAGGETRNNAAGIRTEKSTEVDGLSFVEEVTQAWEPTDRGGFQVTLTNPVSDGQITQIWREGLPWAESMTSHSIAYQLVDQDLN